MCSSDLIQKLQEKGKSDKIIKYLSSSDDTVVVAALEALRRIKDEDSVNSIAHMIDNQDTKIRIEAAKALGSIGTEYAKTCLLYTSGIFSGDSSGHDYYHTIRVYKLATKIAKQENADVKIVQLAALLHDCLLYTSYDSEVRGSDHGYFQCFGGEGA